MWRTTKEAIITAAKNGLENLDINRRVGIAINVEMPL